MYSEKEIKQLEYKRYMKSFPTISFGDIIYAERFENVEQRMQVEVGHTKGPFVVLGRKDDKIIGAYCSSNRERCDMMIGEEYHLFNRRKTRSYLSLSKTRTISYDMYTGKADVSLSNKDKKKIQKYIELNNKKKYKEHGKDKTLTKEFDVEFEIGDIVSLDFHRDNIFIIVDIVNDEICRLIELNGHDRTRGYIDISKEITSINTVYEVPYNELFYRNTALNAQLPIILNKYSNNKNHLKIVYPSKNDYEKQKVVDSKEATNDLIGKIACDANNIFNRYVIASTNPKMCRVISVKNLFQKYSTKSIDMPKQRLSIIDDVDEVESIMISEQLDQLGRKDLAEKVRVKNKNVV